MKNLTPSLVKGVFAVLLCTGMLHAQSPEIVAFSDDDDAAEETEIATGKLSIHRTPKRSWPLPYRIDCKKAGQCLRRSNRFAKDNQLIKAVSYGAYGLTLEPKRRAEKKLLLLVTQDAYDKAYEQHDADVQRLTPLTTEYKGVATAKYAYDLLWEYGQWITVNKVLAAAMTAHPKAAITLRKVDKPQAMALNDTYKGYCETAAGEYYDAGVKALEEAAGKQDFKLAYHYFDITGQYHKGFKDAAEQAKEARKKAMSSLFVSQPAYSDGQPGSGYALDEGVRASITKEASKYRLPFFELQSDRAKSDYVMKMTISDRRVWSEGTTATDETYTEKVKTGNKDADGNEIEEEKTVKITIYEKNVTGSCSVAWEIIERKTGKIVHSDKDSGSYTWYSSWATGSDPYKIVPYSYHKLLGKKPEKQPDNAMLYDQAISNSAIYVGQGAMQDFIKDLGKGLDW